QSRQTMVLDDRRLDDGPEVIVECIEQEQIERVGELQVIRDADPERGQIGNLCKRKGAMHAPFLFGKLRGL
ncbi:hypothetical protein P3G55_23385, partial [Leptospira sp. 96542]|nr:hypothetical protein [Leptospira sp. 96542]